MLIICIILVATMYIDTAKTTVNGKTYVRHLLRESFREGGKVKHLTLGNLSKLPDETIRLLRAALKGELVPPAPGLTLDDVKLHQDISFGAIYALASIAKRLMIAKALGNSPFLKQIIWLIIARIIDQGSRLSASRLANRHAVKEVLGLEDIAVHHLYHALDWVADHQESIEKRLFQTAPEAQHSRLFLYDVTSSYLEGKKNDLANWGYNRDKKKGKMQIVIGLMTDASGNPVTVRVFEGNTADPATCLDQVKLLAEEFGVKDVTLVGDRGMIKTPQIEALRERGFHFITAITKSQIETMINNDIIQYDLFDGKLTEVVVGDIRYILRRNPLRAEEIAASRRQKLASLRLRINRSNTYLQEHERADVAIQLRNLKEFADKLNISAWVKLDVAKRSIQLTQDLDVLAETSKFDGCYAIKTDLPQDIADTSTIHDRYKDLIKVENAFRTMKTECLEVRPVYVRNRKRTRGHVFITMLAYKMVREIERCTPDRKNIPIRETIDMLSRIGIVRMSVDDRHLHRIPIPNPETQALLNQLDVSIPAAIPAKGLEVL